MHPLMCTSLLIFLRNARQGLTPTASGSLGAGVEEAIGRMASAAPLRRGEPVALDEYLVRRGPAHVHT
jgi:hypothetical protein